MRLTPEYIAAAVTWAECYQMGTAVSPNGINGVTRALLQLHDDAQRLSGTTQHCASCEALATEVAELRRVLAVFVENWEDVAPDYIGAYKDEARAEQASQALYAVADEARALLAEVQDAS